jgi:hypothetical protein
MSAGAPGVEEVGFEAFGVRGRMRLPPGSVERIGEVLPPGATTGPPEADDAPFRWPPDETDTAIGALDAEIRAHIALNAPDHIFVHAAAVAIGDRAVVIPGRSFSGKSMLVAALVRAGATYYSDEFAVIDRAGAVLPYAKPISIREGYSTTGTDHPVESLGGTAGVGDARIHLVVVTHYAPGGVWQPTDATRGRGALALLSNTVPVRGRPAQAVASVARAVEHARVLIGPRGEAEPAAAAILDELAAHGRGS